MQPTYSTSNSWILLISIDTIYHKPSLPPDMKPSKRSPNEECIGSNEVIQ